MATNPTDLANQQRGKAMERERKESLMLWRQSNCPMEMLGGLPMSKVNTPHGRRMRLACAGIVRIVARLPHTDRFLVNEARAAARAKLAIETANILDGGECGGLPGVSINGTLKKGRGEPPLIRRICGRAGRHGIMYSMEWLLEMCGYNRSDLYRASPFSSPSVCKVLRDIFPVPLIVGKSLGWTMPDPPGAIADWNTATVKALARQAWDSRDWSILPILADALQDAGCDRELLLEHLRSPGPHVRGCWALDSVLALSVEPTTKTLRHD